MGGGKERALGKLWEQQTLPGKVESFMTVAQLPLPPALSSPSSVPKSAHS